MITLLEQPNATIPQLRFVAGTNRLRARELPVYEQTAHGRETRRVVSHKHSLTANVRVFHVLGFGRTQAAAEAMAGVGAKVVEFSPSLETHKSF